MIMGMGGEDSVLGCLPNLVMDVEARALTAKV